MSTNSITYFAFFLGVFCLFHLLRNKGSWLILLLASYSFYSVVTDPISIIVLLVITIVGFGVGIAIAQIQKDIFKNCIFLLGLIMLLGFMFYYKYYGFFCQCFLLSDYQSHSPHITIIGLSFYVFQTLSYLIDIHLHKIPPERNLGRYALYISWFPKILQGPIERANDLLPQLKQQYVFTYRNIISGLILFLYGLLKKVIIADNLSVIIHPVFSNPDQYYGLTWLISVYIYSLQIYFDFSGYTDMAIGVSKLFNIHLSKNFNFPYLSTSVSDFWRRWHITFSRWLMDYLFLPLQMYWRSSKTMGTVLALAVTFMICGLWHGASWGFIIWGALHAWFMIFSLVTSKYRKKWLKGFEGKFPNCLRWIRIMITFNLISLSWIFFNIKNITDIINIGSNMMVFSWKMPLMMNFWNYSVIVIGVLWVVLEKRIDINRIVQLSIFDKPGFWRHFVFSLIYFGIVFLVFSLMYSFQTDTNQPFIYVQF